MNGILISILSTSLLYSEAKYYVEDNVDGQDKHKFRVWAHNKLTNHERSSELRLRLIWGNQTLKVYKNRPFFFLMPSLILCTAFLYYIEHSSLT